MKGVVFNLLERAVADTHGEEVWDDLVDAAGVAGAYTSLGSYPDEELDRLVAAASAALDVPQAAVVRWFGEATLPMFVARYPALFADHAETRSFVLGLNDIIHPEVHKLYPGASTPSFTFDTGDPDVLLLEYHSERSLCGFAEGLLRGCVTHFGEATDVEHALCRLDGDDRCVLRLSRRRS